MKPLSEQLIELSARAKKTEELVSAAQAKNQAALQSQREELQSSISAFKARAAAQTEELTQEAQSWWDETRTAVNDRFAKLRAKAEDHHAERDLKRAQHRADDAELDAAYAIDFALDVLDQAEYAIADAVIARAEADELARQQG
jgi:hypothetical protein